MHKKLLRNMGNTSKKLLREGDVIKLENGHKVYADIPEHFCYGNRRGSWDLTHHEVTIGKRPFDGDLDYFSGKYVVYKTVTDGGGTGHGPHDVYPDGHHVFCRKVDELRQRGDRRAAVEVDFYQTGAFTAMITDIKPIGRAKLTWTVDRKSEDE